MKVQGQLNATGKRIAIVVSRWNELITKELLDGALDTLGSLGAEDVTVVSVPGTWEIPVAVRGLLNQKARPDAIVALGCILQGQTPHAGLLASDVGASLMHMQTETGVPIAWGVLTPDNQEQALERAGLKMGHKGREAAQAAVEMADLMARLQA